MTDAPIAEIIHPGGHAPTGWKQQALAEWLPANGINPGVVSADAPILVVPIPLPPSGDEGPWMIRVIVFEQYYVGEIGAKETNMLSGRAVTFQRTVPLRFPFPTDPTTGGEDHGQADLQAAQQAPEEQVRDARQEGLPDRHEGQGEERPGESEPARHEGAAEEGEGRSHEAVPEPEEDRSEEEVGAR
ncbi:hypothetical protein AB0G67_40565 [Streptomyces sp. NPDC021056]|uniref:hypothetical protein n=1 Tax=Streptomyces sp. NPDC021056 TaxID=3155012 RepID=UPI0033D98186